MKMSDATRPAEDDRELVSRYLGGDRRAFEILVERHQPRVFGFVQGMIRDRPTAEELTQDIFVRAFRGIAGFRGDASFSTWLYRITVNHVRDHRISRPIRDRDRETSLDGLEEQGFDPPAGRAGPEEERRAAALEAAFHRCVAALEENLREAFLLRHQQNLDYGAVAETLKISRANAKVRVHRAREKLMAILREQGFDV
ncbi:MAG: sigma-70 family RNA polymerase sigma factor [Candidatus Eisenbacteria bacterium]|nr:sigma-70 family RNA polymerase sigma factor [Candidatus Eisenbacteria bacterium]